MSAPGTPFLDEMIELLNTLNGRVEPPDYALSTKIIRLQMFLIEAKEKCVEAEQVNKAPYAAPAKRRRHLQLDEGGRRTDAPSAAVIDEACRDAEKTSQADWHIGGRRFPPLSRVRHPLTNRVGVVREARLSALVEAQVYLIMWLDEHDSWYGESELEPVFEIGDWVEWAVDFTNWYGPISAIDPDGTIWVDCPRGDGSYPCRATARELRLTSRRPESGN